MAFTLFAAQNLTRASHFKALGDGRSGFGLASFAGHGSGVLGADRANARFFVLLGPFLRSGGIVGIHGAKGANQGANLEKTSREIVGAGLEVGHADFGKESIEK
ncbi:MAG: hypothetical protein ACON38_00215 [Akkermansiaceae bacterium]